MAVRKHVSCLQHYVKSL